MTPQPLDDTPSPSTVPNLLFSSEGDDDSALDALFEETEDPAPSTFVPVTIVPSSSPRRDEPVPVQAPPPATTKSAPTPEQFKELQDYHAGLTKEYPAFMRELMQDKPEKESTPAPVHVQPQPRQTPEVPAQTSAATTGYVRSAPARAPQGLAMEALQSQRMAPPGPLPAPRAPPATVLQNDKRYYNFPKSSYISVLKMVPMYDYMIPEGPGKEIVNFTAVEIIAILPHWYQNQWVANRLVSNGIKGGTHQKILRTFRTEAREESTPQAMKDYYIDGIRRCYLGAMRGFGFNRPQHLSDWKLTSHRPPQNWKPFDISVNEFCPDRVRRDGPNAPGPQSVPFRKLLEGVDHLPQGPDAADLTRALNFVLENPMKIQNGCASPWMFPDDLHVILNTVGRTEVTQAHSDGEVVKRYPVDKRAPAPYQPQVPAQHPQSASETPAYQPQARNFSPSVPRAAPPQANYQLHQHHAVNAAVNHATAPHPPTGHQPHQTRTAGAPIYGAHAYGAPVYNANEPPPQTGYQPHQTRTVGAPVYQSTVPLQQTGHQLHQSRTRNTTIDLTTSPRKRARSDDTEDLPAEKRRAPPTCSTSTSNSVVQQPAIGDARLEPELIRISPRPVDNDFGDFAQIIRFAQRYAQSGTTWRWTPEHLADIIRILEKEWVDQLNRMLDVSPHHTSPLIRELRDISNIKVTRRLFEFTRNGVQRKINWRYDAHHMRILLGVDLDYPPWTLPYFAYVVRNFEICRPGCKARMS
ncbi:hypothetical protein BDV96DRAFT_640216 [Lophiotrema nucula]|uniref:Uncharacterized protein n=1 Tax=Lophiotrema nucula TaxID=690887 RepID=A0A6A5ZT34_9PLEO|nr:hypothetical protein BDV96DRAFT_640216 [Lophiotrema nucula]